ncbi:TPA: hypothetical protein QCU33_005324 [Bacillus cereus]|nr:hypothetical protein [Bacillus cereus]
MNGLSAAASMFAEYSDKASVIAVSEYQRRHFLSTGYSNKFKLSSDKIKTYGITVKTEGVIFILDVN